MSARDRAALHPSPLPPAALLSRYGAAYTDCYTTVVAGTVTHAEFVEVFYTGFLFRIERLLLRLFLAKPSTDADVRALAAGGNGDFAAWRVEDRGPDQLLLCDLGGRTRSWLMVAADAGGTRLYFGSAVVPAAKSAGGKPRMGFLFAALLGFHKAYSRALLGSARARLSHRGPGEIR